MPLYSDYERIRYDDPGLQAEFQRLVEAVAAAERARAPIQDQHRKAESDMDTGVVSESDFRSIDRQFIQANNTIAAAKKKVDEFLGRYKNYRVD
jgi:outer membrane protein TolC